MCICINCRHMNNCSTYLFIQKQHQIDTNKVLKKTLFFPHTNITQVNIKLKKYTTQIDWDLTECLSFIESPNSWSNN